MKNKQGEAVNVDAIAAADKMTLQNYGRPYDAAGKPTGTFYKYAKKHEEFK